MGYGSLRDVESALKFELRAANLQSPRSRIRQDAIAATFVSRDCDSGSISGVFGFPEV